MGPGPVASLLTADFLTLWTLFVQIVWAATPPEPFATALVQLHAHDEAILALDGVLYNRTDNEMSDIVRYRLSSTAVIAVELCAKIITAN